MLLNREVCLGRTAPAGPDRCLAENQEHTIRIPSADQTGIKTDAHFTVDEAGAAEVRLIFDLDATIRSITWAPGLGEVVVAPVIRSMDQGDGDS